MTASAALPSITALIPHRAKMVLLDRVLSVQQDTLCAEVVITPEVLFFDGQNNEVGAWVGMEYMAQAIAALEGYSALQRGEPVQVGFLLGTRRYESHCSGFAAGSVLHVEVHRVLEHDNGLGAFECRIADPACNRILATATVTVFKPDNVQQFLKKATDSKAERHE